MRQEPHKQALWLAFLVCSAWWVYLFFSSSMVIVFDAEGYQDLGRLIHNDGWIEFFKRGPSREPLYPWIIAASMSLGDFLHVEHLAIQKVIQILMLAFTQYLSLGVMDRLRLSRRISIPIIIYIGISPALVNATFSSFSEIVALPTTVSVVLVCAWAWKKIACETSWAALLGVSFAVAAVLCLATVAKAIYTGVTIVLLSSFIVLFYFSNGHKQGKMFLRTLVFALLTLALYEVALNSYKGLNAKYNGQYEFTDRYSTAFYGSIKKRSEPLTSKILLMHISSIPGRGFCQRVFSKEECLYCEFETADKLGVGAISLVEHVPENRKNAEIVSLAVGLILRHPFQQALFGLIESMRMFFWESTQMGFVVYPAWLERLYQIGTLKNGLRAVMSLLSVIGFLCMLKSLIMYGQESRHFSDMHQPEPTIIFFIIVLESSFIGLYALFSTLPRYAIPLAPLYLLGIGYAAHLIITVKNSRKIDLQSNV